MTDKPALCAEHLRSSISLYVHVPWCLQKCPYCDFASIATRQSIDEDAFFSAIMRDILRSVESWFIPRFHSVFLGGGTPSLLSPRIIDRLLDQLGQRQLIDQQTEVTIEANPATIEHHQFSDFVVAGVNRLSLGIQSFNDNHLQMLGRIHDRHQAIAAVRSAISACNNVSIDIMYALPNQRLIDIEADLALALSFDIGHMSLYQLTIEENTVFGKNLPDHLPDDDKVDEMEALIQRSLSHAGFMQYETSAFAKEASYQCQHNLNYWLFGDYLGVGPGAHSKLQVSDTTTRQVRPFNVSAYLSHAPAEVEATVLSESDIVIEALMNAGRLTQGFDVDILSRYAGLPVSAFESAINYAVDHGYWNRHQHVIQPTEKGKRFLNQLLCDMFS